jgi:hypothetical protein
VKAGRGIKPARSNPRSTTRPAYVAGDSRLTVGGGAACASDPEAARRVHTRDGFRFVLHPSGVEHWRSAARLRSGRASSAASPCSAASLAFPHASRPSFGNPLGSCDARMTRQFRYATLPGRSGWTLRRGTNPTPRRYTPSSVTIEASPATRVPVPMARRPCATRTAGTKDIPMRIRRLRYVDCSCAPHFSQSNPRNASENNMALRGTTASHLGHRMLLPPTCPQNTGDKLRTSNTLLVRQLHLLVRRPRRSRIMCRNPPSRRRRTRSARRPCRRKSSGV